MPDDETDEGCIHLIYPSTSCTICNPPKVDDTNPSTWDKNRTMIAKFDGQCVECNLPIYADKSTLRKYNGKWLHKRCADQLDRSR